MSNSSKPKPPPPNTLIKAGDVVGILVHSNLSKQSRVIVTGQVTKVYRDKHPRTGALSHWKCEMVWADKNKAFLYTGHYTWVYRAQLTLLSKGPLHPTPNLSTRYQPGHTPHNSPTSSSSHPHLQEQEH